MNETLVTKSHLATIGDEDYFVKTKKKGSKYLSFELISQNTTAEEYPRVAIPNNLVIVDSINSGIGRPPEIDIYSIVIHPILERLNMKHTLIRTTSRDSVELFAKSLSVDKFYTILFISGDTSISEFLNNLPQKASKSLQPFDLCLLPIPMGTGNAWASSLGYLSPIEAFGDFLKGSLTPCKFPLYKAIFPNGNSIVFFIIFSLGFHANLLHACANPKYEHMGNERFQMAGKVVLEEYELDLDISVNDSNNCYAYFALINTPNLEVSYKPSPLSDPLEEELRLLGYSSRLNKERLLEKIMLGYKTKSKEDLPVDENVTYMPLTSEFDIVLNYSPEDSPVYKFEICCDGLLFNLLDQQPEGEFCNKIHIEYVHRYSSFSLKVYAPV